MIDTSLRFVCPRCKGPLMSDPHGFACAACPAGYPVVCGIPDFRLHPDPYIGIEDDRRKGEHLSREGATRTFADLVRYYYAITPDDPPDLAERWTAHALAEVSLADGLLRATRIVPPANDPPGPLLDLGCSTSGLLVAAAGSYRPLVGVDVAFRWLVVGQARLREAGVPATLVCANAEHLPFDDEQFQVVTATDLVEHARDTRAVLQEAYRVSTTGGVTLCTSNNRFWLGLEPNVRLWGVGLLPRRWQARWVALRRGDLHPYRVAAPSARELRTAFRDARYRAVVVEPAHLLAPHVRSPLLHGALAVYNALRTIQPLRALLTCIGPRLQALGRR